MFENFPYTNFHDLNLDWLIEKIMEAYGPDNPPPVGLVLSVNGETGAVVLYKDAIVTLPAVDDTGWNIHRLSDGTSTGIQFIKGQPMQRIDGVNRYNVYDEGNPLEGGKTHGQANRGSVEKDQAADPPAFELAVFDLLWHCLDDHQRLELCAVCFGHGDGKRVDACRFGRISCLFVASHLTRKDRNLCHCPDPCPLFIPPTPRCTQGTAQGDLW